MNILSTLNAICLRNLQLGTGPEQRTYTNSTNVEQECNGSNIGVMDHKIRPSSTLIDEVISRLDSNSYDNTTTSPSFDQVVIAGEGEPTLRIDALLAVSRQIQSHRMERRTGRSHCIVKVLHDMMEAGISCISVALNTANRHEYDFILEVAKVGMAVEIMGIDRPDVDKVETDRLVRLLLSVADKSKRSKVRWRKYFQKHSKEACS
ncbi:hypothetical protein HJC23_002515 [Cyclotella cryptica]|uniref:Uncharacterized protein n=1 Tax=Cyclotella cryptica TaxID=29204 RepID=A0ABD3QZE8_9STRA